MTRGKFITFEGGEGAGKSTQVKLLGQHLRARGIAVVETFEPGGSAFADVLRGVILSGDIPPHTPLAEALLFYAARADHLDATIRPALAAGSWVISDRFSDSTRAYQGAAGGLGDAPVDVLERLVVAGTRPDLTLLLDLDPKVGLARADARRKGSSAGMTHGAVLAVDSYEGRKFEFHERLRAGFLAIAAREPGRVVTLDGFENAVSLSDKVLVSVTDRLRLD